MRSIVYCLALAACGVQGPSDPHTIYGAYSVHRSQTNLEPAPSFDWQADYSIDLAPLSVTITTDLPRDGMDLMITGDHIEFGTTEAWTSPDGPSAPWLAYKLDVLYDGHLTGTAVATASLEAGGGNEFTFDFAITATPL